MLRNSSFTGRYTGDKISHSYRKSRDRIRDKIETMGHYLKTSSRRRRLCPGKRQGGLSYKDSHDTKLRIFHVTDSI